MVELELFEQDYNYSFERMLGWAWFLKLQQVGGGTNENLKIMLRFQEPGSSVCLLSRVITLLLNQPGLHLILVHDKKLSYHFALL